MKRIAKKPLVLLLVFLLVALALRFVPIQTFTYQTSNSCSSNLDATGTNERTEYRLIGGGWSEYSQHKSNLESLNIPQNACNEPGFAPQDYETLWLYAY